MRKIRKFFLILLSFVAVSSLSGCSSNSDFAIELKTPGIAYLYIEYNFEKYIIKEDGASYSIIAQYYDNETAQMESLDIINSFRFIPLNRNDIIVTVNGQKGNAKAQKKTTIRVGVQGDPVDELLATGASSYSDEGIIKELNFNEDYITDGDSSIEVSYYGRNYYPWGCAVICPNNFRCLQYWTDQEWSNAVLTFDVYNPTAYDFYFELRVYEDPQPEGYPRVDIDWGYPINTRQTAKPLQWTTLYFSMRKIGINHKLYIADETYKPFREDELLVKTWWAGTPGTYVEPETYSWKMFIDNVDFVDADDLPVKIDTVCEASAETYEKGYENLALDTGENSSWGRSRAVYDREIVRDAEFDSKSSMIMTFKDSTYLDEQLKYSVIFDTDAESKKEASKFVLPDFSHGTISFDIKFSSDIEDKKVSFVAAKDWETGGIQYIKEITLEDLEDGWYRLDFDFATVSQYASFEEVIRFGLSFPGVTEENKQTAVIHIDNIFFDQNGSSGKRPLAEKGELITPAGKTMELNVPEPVPTSSTEIIIDYKIVSSGSDDQIAFMIFDSTLTWDEYFGYFIFTKDGAIESYKGISVTESPDGNDYLRITIVANELDLYNEGYSSPSTLDSIYFRPYDWTTANARVEIVSVTY